MSPTDSRCSNRSCADFKITLFTPQSPNLSNLQFRQPLEFFNLRVFIKDLSQQEEQDTKRSKDTGIWGAWQLLTQCLSIFLFLAPWIHSTNTNNVSCMSSKADLEISFMKTRIEMWPPPPNVVFSRFWYAFKLSKFPPPYGGGLTFYYTSHGMKIFIPHVHRARPLNGFENCPNLTENRIEYVLLTTWDGNSIFFSANRARPGSQKLPLHSFTE